MKKIFYLSAGLITAVFVIQQIEFVLAPLALALVLAICISPLVNYLIGKNWNKTLASIGTSLVLILVLIGIVVFISKQYYSIVDGLPNLGAKTEALLNEVLVYFSDLTGIDSSKLMDSMKGASEKIQGALGKVIGSLWSSLSNMISFLFVLPVFLILVLLYKEKLKNVFVSIISSGDDQNAKATYLKLKQAIRGYILGLGVVILVLSILNTVGLLLLGIPFAFALGVSSAALTVIPYVGILLGGGLAVIVAFATKDDSSSMLAVIGLFAGVQILEGNLITPKIQGDKLNLNMLTVIIALMLGAFVWGFIGMILAVPGAAILRVMLEHSEKTKVYAKLMAE